MWFDCNSYKEDSLKASFHVEKSSAIAFGDYNTTIQANKKLTPYHHLHTNREKSAQAVASLDCPGPALKRNPFLLHKNEPSSPFVSSSSSPRSSPLSLSRLHPRLNSSAR
ncbi:unnamed protein product [Microthlaspi erraticum]|uniref:Uncharacterized protein n=1 Tax=Microthlaspi erraticum TaxID=1685480 RepID=A0A6D2L7G6_9BRAS|nr:unnamed protein product [Microthlaspi erraticum]